MSGWLVLLIVLAVLFLLSLIRLGGEARYGPEGVRVRLIAGPFRVQLVPARKKEKPEKKQKKKREKPPKKAAKAEKPQAEDKPGSLELLMKLLPTVTQAAGALKRKIRIDRLTLRVVWGGEDDPAAAALNYGRSYAIMGMIYPQIEHHFKVKHSELLVEVDYSKQGPEIHLDAALTITVGQILSFGVIYGTKLLIQLSRSGKRSVKQQEADNNE